MSRLVRMDRTGHTTLAEWTAEDPASVEAAVQAFRAELDRGYFAMVSTGEGHAEQVKELPLDAELVILRLPISGGGAVGHGPAPGDRGRPLAAAGRRAAAAPPRAAVDGHDGRPRRAVRRPRRHPVRGAAAG